MGQNFEIIWKRQKLDSFDWERGNVRLPTGYFRISFEARLRTSTEELNIALDDIRIDKCQEGDFSDIFIVIYCHLYLLYFLDIFVALLIISHNNSSSLNRLPNSKQFHDYSISYTHLYRQTLTRDGIRVHSLILKELQSHSALTSMQR